jgi:hypothetical protein
MLVFAQPLAWVTPVLVLPGLQPLPSLCCGALGRRRPAPQNGAR